MHLPLNPRDLPAPLKSGPKKPARRPRLALTELEDRTVPAFYPLGGEFDVVTAPTNSRTVPAIAAGADGDFVVAWQSSGQDGSGDGIYAQRYNGAGVALGSDFRVNTYATSSQRTPSIAMDADGDFVIAWESHGPDESSFGIYAQRYNAIGVAQGSEFRVNTFTTNSQTSPTIAMDTDGDFVVAWVSFGQDGSSDGIYAQRYNGAGATQGSEFRVNTSTVNGQRNPTIAMDTDGDFVVAWEGYEGSGYGIYAQRYNGAGVAQGSEIHVNTYTTNGQNSARIAMDVDGDFVIAWASNGQDGSGYGIYAQRYNGAGVAQGTEFQVNTYTTSTQRRPTIAMDADGDFVVAWQSYFQDGSETGVYAQRYNGAGVAQGTEFLVNTSTTSHQLNSTIGIDAVGNFIVAWQGLQTGAYDVFFQRYSPTGSAVGVQNQAAAIAASFVSNLSIANDATGNHVIAWSRVGGNGSGEGIYAQRYNAAGTALGSEFQVNTYTTNEQRNPAIAMDADGDFVIAWQSNGQDGSSYGIYAQRYNAAGVAQGSEFRVNTFTTNEQRRATIAMDADGDFVVGWESNGQDGSGYGIYAQRYNGAGVAQGSEFRVNTYTPSRQSGLTIAMDADGDFVVAWESSGQDGSGYGIYAQRYNGAGVAQGSEYRVNTYTTGSQTGPTIAMHTDGDFVIAWSSNGQDGSGNGMYGQRYNAAGVAQWSEFRVNTYTINEQRIPTIAMDADGDFVVAWSSYGQDGSGYGIYAQRYNAAGGPQEPEFRVNTHTLNSQFSPAMAMNAVGDFTIVWYGGWKAGNTTGIYGQRYVDNDAPTGIALANSSLPEGNAPPTLVGLLSADDPDGGDTLTFTLVPGSGDQDNAAFEVVDTEFRATTVLDHETKSEYSVRVRATDQHGLWFERTFAINVTNVNEAPVLTDDAELSPILQGSSNPLGRQAASLFAGLVVDPDPNAALSGLAIVGNTATAATEGKWQYSTDAGTSWFDIGTVADDATALALAASTRIRFLPVITFSGTPTSLVVRAIDDAFLGTFTSGPTRQTVDASINGGTMAISATTATIETAIFPTGTGGNTVPTLSGVPVSANINEGQTLTFTATASDPDVGQTLAFSLDGAPAAASIHPDTGEFSWITIEGDGPNTYVFNVLVTDGFATSEKTVTVIVGEVNTTPVLADVPATAKLIRGQKLPFTATATDGDLLNGLGKNALTFSLIGAPSDAFIHPDTGVFSWTPSDSLSNGTYGFQVRVVDDGVPAKSATANVSVTLHDAYLEAGILRVGGTAGKDTITVTPNKDGSLLAVKLGKASLGSFDTSLVNRIEIRGLAGDDKITVNTKITKEVDMYGGAGNDMLTGGSGNNRLFGEAGNDTLKGGKANNLLVGGDGNDKLTGGIGRDVIIGGAGADKLSGSSGEDLLIGGATNFDTDLAGLMEIFNVWTSTVASYDERVDTLTLGGSVDGPVLLSTSSVPEDGLKDILTGAADKDWLIGGTSDKLDLKTGEKSGTE